MPKPPKTPPKVKETISSDRVSRAIVSLADKIADTFDVSSPDVALVGVQTRGVTLARRVAAIYREKRNLAVPVGALDITLYRDDFSTSGIQPIVGETDLDFGIEGKDLILVDDVLFTGRTVRAALDELMDFGRPRRIALAVLVDRGHRELPIQPDFCTLKVSTNRDESVILRLKENDGIDELVVCEPVQE